MNKSDTGAVVSWRVGKGGTIVVDVDGTRQVYASLDDAPADVQQRIKELRRGARPGQTVHRVRVGQPKVRIRTARRRDQTDSD